MELRKMKTFTEVIKVEVPVNALAQKLLATMQDFEHGTTVVESIISCMLKGNNLLYLYNSLHGFTNEINFSVGQEITCSDTSYQYEEILPLTLEVISNVVEPVLKPSKSIRSYKPIGNCVIVKIDLYIPNKIQVKFDTFDIDGQPTTDTEWVNHLHCDSISFDMDY